MCVAPGPKRISHRCRTVLVGLAWSCAFSLSLSAGGKRASAQCQGPLTSLEDAARCTARSNVPMSKAEIDPTKPYRLDELIDIAETNNPRTRIAWETTRPRNSGRTSRTPVDENCSAHSGRNSIRNKLG